MASPSGPEDLQPKLARAPIGGIEHAPAIEFRDICAIAPEEIAAQT